MQVLPNDLDVIKQYLKPPAEAAHIKQASTWVDSVVEAITNPSQDSSGVPIQYLNYQNSLRFRLGEVTIWAGANGHGKSLILNQFVLWAMGEVKTLIISPEMPVAKTMQRMVYQATRQRHSDEQNIRAFHDYTDGKLWLYDQLGTVKRNIVFAVIRYAVNELGIQHVIIDSLMKCGMGDDAYNDQKAFVDELCTIAKDLNIHIHLVAHSRKGESENRLPDKYDIKGSGTITDLVDNVLLMWRNKPKEEELRRLDMKRENLHQRTEIESKPDAMLMCKKQRHGDWEGNIPLWFDLSSQLFKDAKNQRVTPKSWTR